MIKAKKQLVDKTQPPLHHLPQVEGKEMEEEQNKGDKPANEDNKGKRSDAELSRIEEQPPE